MKTAGRGARRASLSWRDGFRRVSRVVRRVIGVPDYETYVEHRLRRHPGEPMLTKEQFVRERQRARYETVGGRCC